ncbi:hypothetical protein KEM52_000100, partial [Ascosphaera acerosa]
STPAKREAGASNEGNDGTDGTTRPAKRKQGGSGPVAAADTDMDLDMVIDRTVGADADDARHSDYDHDHDHNHDRGSKKRKQDHPSAGSMAGPGYGDDVQFGTVDESTHPSAPSLPLQSEVPSPFPLQSEAPPPVLPTSTSSQPRQGATPLTAEPDAIAYAATEPPQAMGAGADDGGEAVALGSPAYVEDPDAGEGAARAGRPHKDSLFSVDDDDDEEAGGLAQQQQHAHALAETVGAAPAGNAGESATATATAPEAPHYLGAGVAGEVGAGVANAVTPAGQQHSERAHHPPAAPVAGSTLTPAPAVLTPTASPLAAQRARKKTQTSWLAATLALTAGLDCRSVVVIPPALPLTPRKQNRATGLFKEQASEASLMWAREYHRQTRTALASAGHAPRDLAIAAITGSMRSVDMEAELKGSATTASAEKTDVSVQELSAEEVEAAALSPEHREYLLARHGTLELNPMPSMDPADPLNWPAWKKNVNLYLISFHAMMTTFGAAAVIPVYETFSEIFNISITQASYLTSNQILILGIAPIFWKPVSNRFGRRPIWLLSALGSCVCNLGNAYAHSYATQVVVRLLQACMISPAIAISSAVVTETYFAKERASKMGIWTLMVTLGPPTGPFLMGFVAYHTGSWQWIYKILAITNAVQFILYLFLSPETLYVRGSPAAAAGTTQGSQKQSNKFVQQYLTFGRKGPKPLTLNDFTAWIKFFAYPDILFPTVAYAMVFNFCNVLGTVEIPAIFGPRFHFNPQQTGLNFLGMIIGSGLGEVLGGWGSDHWMQWKSKKLGGHKHPEPEYRLWLSYIGFACAICGLTVFCVQTDNIKSYNVTPIVGIAIASFGNQVITTVCTTYAVDCHRQHSASIGVFINFTRSTWAFLGPIWFPHMFANLGLKGSAGLLCGLIGAFSVLPTLFVHTKGQSIRENRHIKEMEAAQR